MNMDFIKDVIVPILTPIDEEENIDEKKLREQVDYVTEGDVLGILAFGSSGEFYVTKEDEMERGLTIMVDQAARRVPVYFGIGTTSTKKCCHLAKMVVANGAAGVFVLQSMFLRPAESGLYLHFRTIVKSVSETLMLLYNNSGRANYTLSANLADHLAHEVEDIMEMEDTSSSITQTSKFIRKAGDVNFKVLGGKDTLLYTSLCHSAVGGVCIAANPTPELITDVYNRFVTRDLNDSLEAQSKLNLVRLSIDGASFPVVAKGMVNLRGRKIGLPYTPSLSTPEGPVLDRIRREMELASLI